MSFDALFTAVAVSYDNACNSTSRISHRGPWTQHHSRGMTEELSFRGLTEPVHHPSWRNHDATFSRAGHHVYVLGKSAPGRHSKGTSMCSRCSAPCEDREGVARPRAKNPSRRCRRMISPALALLECAIARARRDNRSRCRPLCPRVQIFCADPAIAVTDVDSFASRFFRGEVHVAAPRGARSIHSGNRGTCGNFAFAGDLGRIIKCRLPRRSSRRCRSVRVARRHHGRSRF